MRTRILALACACAALAATGCDTRTGGFTSLAISTDASLASLQTSAGSLDPVFDPERAAFNLQLPDSIAQVRVIPTARSQTASITVNGQDVTNGALSSPVSIAGELTSIPVAVTAQSGLRRVYTISVLRAP